MALGGGTAAGGREYADARRRAIAEFAAALRELRAAAGEPSFREMARVSGAVSHTTLHEAVSGARLPSWPTIRAFVRACGGDEAEWQRRWSTVSGQLAALAGGTPGGVPAAERTGLPERTGFAERTERTERTQSPELARLPGAAACCPCHGSPRAESPWRSLLPAALFVLGVVTGAVAAHRSPDQRRRPRRRRSPHKLHRTGA